MLDVDALVKLRAVSHAEHGGCEVLSDISGVVGTAVQVRCRCGATLTLVTEAEAPKPAAKPAPKAPAKVKPLDQEDEE